MAAAGPRAAGPPRTPPRSAGGLRGANDVIVMLNLSSWWGCKRDLAEEIARRRGKMNLKYKCPLINNPESLWPLNFIKKIESKRTLWELHRSFWVLGMQLINSKKENGAERKQRECLQDGFYPWWQAPPAWKTRLRSGCGGKENHRWVQYIRHATYHYVWNAILFAVLPSAGHEVVTVRVQKKTGINQKCHARKKLQQNLSKILCEKKMQQNLPTTFRQEKCNKIYSQHYAKKMQQNLPTTLHQKNATKSTHDTMREKDGGNLCLDVTNHTPASALWGDVWEKDVTGGCVGGVQQPGSPGAEPA